jgi:DNA-directed RNA polymerase subunit M/transcription elongation factor TFIIS
VPDDASQVITFSCIQCAKKLRAPIKLVGRKLPCPRCSTVVEVPHPESIASKQETPPAEKAPEVKRSVFDDDLPDLAPLTQVYANPIDTLEPIEDVEILEDDVPQPVQSTVKKPASGQKTPSSGKAPDVKPAAKPSSTRPADAKNPVRPSTNPSPTPALQSTPSKPSVIPSQPAAAGGEDDEFALVPLEPLAAAKPNTQNSLESLLLEQSALIPTGVEQRYDEFSYKCRVCSTMLYAKESEVGGKQTCPDCYTEVTIPPPANKTRVKTTQRQRDEADLPLTPVEAKSIRAPETVRINADQMMDRAKEDVAREKAELDAIRGSFDSKRWIGLLFWFFQDRAVVLVTIMMGVVSAFWLGFVGIAPRLFELEGTRAAVLQLVVFCIPLIPIVGSCLLVSLSIFSMVANQMKRIDDWPFSRFGDAMGDLMTLFFAIAIAVVPGGALGSLMSPLLGGWVSTIAFSLISIWFLFPFVFLSIANNNSITEPYSQVVFNSLKERPDAWGAMYMQTMLAFGGYFVLIAIALIPGFAGELLCGLVLPLFLFFVMNQYGLLAGRLSDLTNLGFEGDFSQDNSPTS